MSEAPSVLNIICSKLDEITVFQFWCIRTGVKDEFVCVVCECLLRWLSVILGASKTLLTGENYFRGAWYATYENIIDCGHRPRVAATIPPILNSAPTQLPSFRSSSTSALKFATDWCA